MNTKTSTYDVDVVHRFEVLHHRGCAYASPLHVYGCFNVLVIVLLAMAAARPSVGFTFTQNIDYRRRGSATAQRNSRRHGSSSSGSGGGGGAGGGAGASTTGTRRIISDARQAVAAQAKSSCSFTMAPRRRTMSPIAPTTGQPARRKGTNGTTGRLTIMEQVFGPGAGKTRERQRDAERCKG